MQQQESCIGRMRLLNDARMIQYCSGDAGGGDNNTHLRVGWPANTPPLGRGGAPSVPLLDEEGWIAKRDGVVLIKAKSYLGWYKTTNI